MKLNITIVSLWLFLLLNSFVAMPGLNESDKSLMSFVIIVAAVLLIYRILQPPRKPEN